MEYKTCHRIRFSYQGMKQAPHTDTLERYLALIPEGRSIDEIGNSLRATGYPLEHDSRTWHKPYARYDKSPSGHQVIDGVRYGAYPVTIVRPCYY